MSAALLMNDSAGLTAQLTVDSRSCAVLVPETPIRPTATISKAPNVVHSRRIVRRVAVIAFIWPSWPRSGSARWAGVCVRHQHFFHQVQFLQDHARAAYHACQRVVGHMNRHLG